ncbi:unnamed protein product [Mesocestoides corti]|uniref:Uncharacterized protein n=1 Tax=Mesocestoides corti TaxID=53468 RepID=A0A0R3U5L4_MESCO|nr:unnamed protein product [Mesocestoides corti]
MLCVCSRLLCWTLKDRKAARAVLLTELNSVIAHRLVETREREMRALLRSRGALQPSPEASATLLSPAETSEVAVSCLPICQRLGKGAVEPFWACVIHILEEGHVLSLTASFLGWFSRQADLARIWHASLPRYAIENPPFHAGGCRVGVSSNPDS